MKRSLPNSEQVRQDDGTDFRESKVRKVEIPSPSENLFASSFDLSSTFDKQDDSFSMFSFHDPGSLLSQPLLNDSKPVIVGKTSFANTINGIETNPALVSSLLKESLCSTESKFGTLGTSGNGSNSATTAATSIALGSSKQASTAQSSQSVSSLSASSAPSIVSNVPEATIKTEAPSSLDVNAPSAISSLLAQSTPIMSTAPTLLAPLSSLGSVANLALISSELTTLTGDSVSALTKEEEHRRSKSEKKKKKDKHKHKEKDKSKDKDREERKKHKKDKDRHRDREREKSDQPNDPSAMVPGPIKIKLPKDKLNLHPLTEPGGNPAPAAASDMGLKIKIPKDRLSGASSLSSSTGAGGTSAAPGAASSAAGQSAPPSTTPLKLKISKDKIEHYNISDGSFNNGSGHGHATGTGGHHSHGNKKKDRDKERDKSKSSKSMAAAATATAGSTMTTSEYNKQNGNTGGNNGGSSASGGQAGNTSSKSSSSKVSDDLSLYF